MFAAWHNIEQPVLFVLGDKRNDVGVVVVLLAIRLAHASLADVVVVRCVECLSNSSNNFASSIHSAAGVRPVGISQRLCN